MPNLTPNNRAARPKTAVIADDHPIVRQAVADVVGDLGLQVVREASTGPDAIAAAKACQPDLVVLDISMPDAHGSEIFLEIRKQSPRSRIAVYTGLTSSGILSDLLTAGVDGLFLKQGDPALLARGLHMVVQGAKFASPDVVALLEERPPGPALSPRERQILNLVTRGLTNAEIGDQLGISPKTVDNHRTSLMSKLDVHSLSELLAYALREGLLDGAAQN